MKRITVELSAQSCGKALKELQQYEKQIKPKLDEVCKRLAEIGAQEASARFARGDHGNGGVVVTTEQMENGYKVVASGHDVYFIEFGTGFDANPHGYKPTVPVYPGSWSEGHAQKFSEYGYWYYGGERLQGTEAEMPMYYAERAIRENEKRIVQEVFGK